VNDALGHAAGDELLIALALRLKQTVRESDVVCRHSGDEFTLLLRDAHSWDEVAATADRLLKAIEEPLALRGHDFGVSASIGIALFPDDAADHDELVRHADAAMYAAKRMGRARHSFFRSEFNSHVQATLQLEKELAAALEHDEFVILAEKATLDELTALADQVLYSLDLPVRSGPHGMRVSASIGIVVQSVGSSGPAEILKAADLTLYRAKAAGRSRWACYDAKLNEAQVARYALVEKLPDAVQRGEFSLLYQPLVSLNTGQACGVEALLRWHHPERGLLSPDEFIDLAEESGVISAIGGWVLREACRQAATWWRRFPDREFYVSVNIATAQTYDPALVGDVLSILHESGLPPTLLQLELTESAMLNEIAPVEALRALAEAGIRIAIDDFGTGYSNLAYLKTLPVAGLKLARQFTDGLGAPVDTQIVKTLIELAHVLDLAVTAEGVETPEQLAQLSELNCDVVQGWHLSMPLPADEMTAVLETEV
jgi:diguanylate cyclase (GGDEF)-like protein